MTDTSDDIAAIIPDSEIEEAIANFSDLVLDGADEIATNFEADYLSEETFVRGIGAALSKYFVEHDGLKKTAQQTEDYQNKVTEWFRHYLSVAKLESATEEMDDD